MLISSILPHLYTPYPHRDKQPSTRRPSTRGKIPPEIAAGGSGSDINVDSGTRGISGTPSTEKRELDITFINNKPIMTRNPIDTMKSTELATLTVD